MRGGEVGGGSGAVILAGIRLQEKDTKRDWFVDDDDDGDDARCFMF